MFRNLRADPELSTAVHEHGNEPAGWRVMLTYSMVLGVKKSSTSKSNTTPSSRAKEPMMSTSSLEKAVREASTSSAERVFQSRCKG